MKTPLVIFTLSSIFSIAASGATILALDLGTEGSALESDSFTSPTDGSSAAFQEWMLSGEDDLSETSSTSNLYTSGSVTLTFSTDHADTFDRGILAVNEGTFEDLYRDGIVNGGTLTLSGLNPDSFYGLTIQAFEPAAERESIFTPITAGVTNPPAVTISGSFDTPPGNDLFAPDASVSFNDATALTSDSSGSIMIQLSGGTYEAARVNGIELYTAVPEPSTYALLAGVAALGLAFARRRS